MTRNLRRLASTEADTLKAITEYLEVLQTQGRLLYIRHSPSNVVGKKGEATFRRPKASQAGAADLVIFRTVDKGHWNPKMNQWCFVTDVLCIEVKSSTGKLSPAQERWAEKAVAQGCKYIVARSLEDVTSALK